MVKIRKFFIDLYVRQGVTYRTFYSRALKSLSAVEINSKIVTQSVNKVVEAYSRVYDVLKEHREQVIEAFTRKSSFDTEAALVLLESCELRRFRGDKATTPDYPDIEEYDCIATCANAFDVFSQPIAGQDLIDFRDGTLTKPLSARNMARAVFLLSVLEKLRYLPRNWKSSAVANQMLVSEKSGKTPALNYLYTSADRNNAEQYLADTTSPKFFSRESFYVKIARAIQDIVLRRK